MSGDGFGLGPGKVAISHSYDDYHAAEMRVWRLMCEAVLTKILRIFIEDVNGALRHLDVNMGDWTDRAFMPGLGINRQDNLGRVRLFRIGDFEKWKKDLPVGPTPGPVERCRVGVPGESLDRFLGAESQPAQGESKDGPPSASKQADDPTQATPEAQSETPPAAAQSDEPMAANPAQARPAAQPEAAPPVTQPNDSTIDIQVSALAQGAPEAHLENLPAPDGQQRDEPPLPANLGGRPTDRDLIVDVAQRFLHGGVNIPRDLAPFAREVRSRLDKDSRARRRNGKVASLDTIIEHVREMFWNFQGKRKK
jgi:hypothetical protein